jgi:tRNA uridine 5-carbamoylmethylation protein Kti12
VRMVMCEVSPAVLRARNQARDEPVPTAVVARMIERWDLPDGSDAHALVVAEG